MTTKFRVKVLLESGENHTEVVEADSPNTASAVATKRMRERGIVVSKVLTTKKWKGEDNHEAPSISNAANRLFGGSARVVHVQDKHRHRA